MNENQGTDENTLKKIPAWRYVLKVTFYHIITYIGCGMIFSNLFNYTELYQLGNMAYFMKPVNSASSYIGPFFQILRGLIFGFILLLLRDYLSKGKYGFLKLYAFISVFGIINTPGPAPGSIEGIIYTQLPWECHVYGSPEILVQTFLFSLLVCNIDKPKKQLPEKVKRCLITAIICTAGYSAGGIIIAVILKVDIASQASSVQSYITLGITGFVCYALTYFYLTKKSDGKKWWSVLYYFIMYLICAVYPTVFNYLTDSPFKTPLSFLVSGLPVAVMALYLERKKSSPRKQDEQVIN